MDRFFTNETVQFSESNGQKYIPGYASVFYDGSPGTEYNPKQGIKVRIAKGAFDDYLKSGGDILALFNHDQNQMLGRLKNDTLSVKQTDKGLMYQIPYDPEDPDHVRVMAKIKKGDVDGSSFGGKEVAKQWTKEGDDQVKTITKFSLRDVSPVVDPAFTGSSVWSAGDDAELIKEAAQWAETHKREEIIKRLTK